MPASLYKVFKNYRLIININVCILAIDKCACHFFANKIYVETLY